ncbi:hypothetical protein L6164_001077 [Bauhinia variegata]|uniref:Uncharacterized protein n=1 Tax=Bauhinia variegata TaxID=167791 RepID=A0ACB9Q8P6_BAUVA|nr:hypothetical protein L6164_001077 [Bauhinia variegata]
MFTEDEAIVSLLSSTLPIVGLCELGNCPQTTICGVLRGSTRPSYAVKINLGSFYAVGLLIPLIMGCLETGLLGSLVSVGCGSNSLCCCHDSSVDQDRLGVASREGKRVNQQSRE